MEPPLPLDAGGGAPLSQIFILMPPNLAPRPPIEEDEDDELLLDPPIPAGISTVGAFALAPAAHHHRATKPVLSLAEGL